MRQNGRYSAMKKIDVNRTSLLGEIDDIHHKKTFGRTKNNPDSDKIG